MKNLTNPWKDKTILINTNQEGYVLTFRREDDHVFGSILFSSYRCPGVFDLPDVLYGVGLGAKIADTIEKTSVKLGKDLQPVNEKIFEAIKQMLDLCMARDEGDLVSSAIVEELESQYEGIVVGKINACIIVKGAK